jgi:hypothetical protein
MSQRQDHSGKKRQHFQIEQLSSFAAAAAALDRSEHTIRRWRRRPDWPFSPKPPWPLSDLAAWAANLQPDHARQWRAEHGDDYAASLTREALLPHGERAIKLKLLAERTAKLHLERKVAERKLVDATERLQQELRALHGMKASLLELGRTLSARICELTGWADRRHVEDMIETEIRRILQAFADGWVGPGPRAGEDAVEK